MQKLLIILILAFFPVAAFADNKKEILADELIVISQVDKVLDQMRDQVERLTESMVGQMELPEGAPEEAKKDIADFQKRLISKSFEIMDFKNFSKLMRDIFVDVYTEEELAGLVQFYKSSVGQSMVAKQPLIFKKTIETTQIRMKTLVPEMQAMGVEFVESMKKKYPDIEKGHWSRYK